MVFVGTDGDTEGFGKGSSLEALNVRGHCGREEIGAALAWEDFEDLGNDGAKVCWGLRSQVFSSLGKWQRVSRAYQGQEGDQPRPLLSA